MGQICKGAIASIDGDKARIIPLGKGTKSTAKIVIPVSMRGGSPPLTKGTEVVYAEFSDGTGLLLGRADGE